MLKNLKILILLCSVILLGFASKYYRGPFEFWVNNSLGGVFYVIFWCLFFHFTVYFLKLKIRLEITCFSVLMLTCLLEFLQLVHMPFLNQIRSSYMGKILIGNTFTLSDFIYYFAGAFLAWIFLRKSF